MSKMPYPIGMDCIWLASDREGNLGVFITNGDGPIPVVNLELDLIFLPEIEDLVLKMNVTSDSDLLVQIPFPEDLTNFSDRGFFVYDWFSSVGGAYQAVSIPRTPLSKDALVGDLRLVAETVRLANFSFLEQRRLDVRESIACEMPSI